LATLTAGGTSFDWTPIFVATSQHASLLNHCLGNKEAWSLCSIAFVNRNDALRLDVRLSLAYRYRTMLFVFAAFLTQTSGSAHCSNPFSFISQ
jgi:hypothetical protein